MNLLPTALKKSSLFAVTLTLLLQLTSITNATAADRIALLIGNNKYPDTGLFGSLDNPVNDVGLIAQSLKTAGFKVILITDADRTTMNMKVGEFQDEIEPGGTALFYFAGHGIQFDGENYLMASNAKLLKKYQLGDESLRAQTVLDAMGDKKPKSSFVFLDCCRNKPPKSWMESDTRSAKTRGLADMDAQDMIISFSAAPGEPAADGEGTYSPFAESLSKHLLSGKELAPMLRNVAGEVWETTGKVQRPWHNGNFLHEFYFTPKSMAQQVVDTAPGIPAVTAPITPGSITPGNIINGSITPQVSAAMNGGTGYQPILPMALPAKGHFSNDEVFAGSAYSGYNDYSKSIILKRAQGVLDGAGKADGKMGPNTQSSINAYQAANQLPLTGRIDQATLTRMGLVGLSEQSKPVAKYTPKKSSSSSSRTYRPSSSSSSKKSSSSSSGNFNAQQFLKNANAISGAMRRFR